MSGLGDLAAAVFAAMSTDTLRRIVDASLSTSYIAAARAELTARGEA
jgi:hypothetical protein